MKKVAKAQASVELIVYVSIMLVIFGVAAVSAGSKQKEIYDERVFAEARNIINSAATEIDEAVSVGDGYSHVFAMPDKILGEVNYTVGIDQYYQNVYIEWSGKNYSLPLTSNVNGSFFKGDDKIYNRGGVITIERATAV